MPHPDELDRPAPHLRDIFDAPATGDGIAGDVLIPRRRRPRYDGTRRARPCPSPTGTPTTGAATSTAPATSSPTSGPTTTNSSTGSGTGSPPRTRRYAGPWNEQLHPRGQPENAGEFGPKNNAAGGSAATAPAPAPSAPAPSPQAQQGPQQAQPVPAAPQVAQQPLHPEEAADAREAASKERGIRVTGFAKDWAVQALQAKVGRPVRASDLAAIVGAGDDATVRVYHAQEDRNGTTYEFEVEGKDEHGREAYTMSRSLVIPSDPEEPPHLENVTFEVEPHLQGKGIGTERLAEQVASAHELGIPGIKTYGARDTAGRMNGYYTWPRLGYDGALNEGIRANLPPELAHARDVSDLMRTKAGRDWWLDNGRGVYLTFDTNPSSTCRRVLDAYRAEKAAGAGGKPDDRTQAGREGSAKARAASRPDVNRDLDEAALRDAEYREAMEAAPYGWHDTDPSYYEQEDPSDQVHRHARRNPPVRYAVRHAPHNMTIGGKNFTGGEFIPGADLAQATPEQKAMIGAAGGSAATRAPAPAPAPAAPPDPIQDYRQNGIRAASFKSWFGDWEKDPASASKVVNPKTGEPEVEHPIPVYHGTARGGFGAFDPAKQDPDALYGPGFYFTENREIADSYTAKDAPVARALLFQEAEALNDYVAAHDPGGKAGDRPFTHTFDAERAGALQDALGWDDATRAGFREAADRAGVVVPNRETKSAYLNIRNPFDVDRDDIDLGRLTPDQMKAAGVGERHLAHAMKRRDSGAATAHDWHELAEVYGKRVAANLVRALGHDGITHIGGNVWGGARLNHRVWIAFAANQIKSTDNRGTFDPADNRIRYAATWNEQLHPRGQPANRGEFAPKGQQQMSPPSNPRPGPQIPERFEISLVAGRWQVSYEQKPGSWVGGYAADPAVARAILASPQGRAMMAEEQAKSDARDAAGREDQRREAENHAAWVAEQRTLAGEVAKAGKPCMVRFGGLPEGGRSYNSRDNYLEKGVSVYAAWTLPGRRVVLDLRKADIISSMVLRHGKTAYIVTGDRVGTGADGEPLLANAAVARKVPRNHEILDLAYDEDDEPPPPPGGDPGDKGPGPVRYAAGWDDAKHPRGQPENAGEFGPGGSSSGGSAATSGPAPPAPAPIPTPAAKPSGSREIQKPEWRVSRKGWTQPERWGDHHEAILKKAEAALHPWHFSDNHAGTRSPLWEKKARTYGEAMRDVVGAMPPGMAGEVARRLAVVEFHPSLAGVGRSLKRQGGTVEKGQWVGGFCVWQGDGTSWLMLDGGFSGGPGTTIEPGGGSETIRDIYAHELSHVIDPSGFRSDSSEWQEAWQREIATGAHPLSRYASTDNREGFAEFGRLVLSGASHREVAGRFPTAYHLWEANGWLR